MKLCRITVFAYQFGDIPKGREHGYEDKDLLNAIEYCNDLIDQGFAKEPMDHFGLQSFIKWAENKIEEDSGN